MKSIIDYLTKSENLGYSIILIVTLVVLIGMTVAVVLVYRRSNTVNAQKSEDIAVAAADDKQMPENIVDDPYEDYDDEEPQSEKDAKEILRELKPEEPDPYVIDRSSDKKHKPKAQHNESNSTPVFKPVSSYKKQSVANKEKIAEVPAGKWVIITESDGKMYAFLKTDSEEKLLSTESYSSLSGIKSGIDTLKKNIENENYAINLDKNGNFVFKIFTSANRILCVSEGYITREQCETAFNQVKRLSNTAAIVIEK